MKDLWEHTVIVIFFLVSFQLSAQVDNGWDRKPQMTISGFADVFYVYDFNEPPGTFRQPFLFNHNRHNEFNLNLGLVALSLEHTKYRANLGLQTGVYANDNYAAEPGLLKSIFEANIGISLNSQNNLWLNAGILPSHIGFESAISINNPTLTRSLLAENSPYFLTGVKLTYNPSPRWELAGLVVNGWQRIQRLEGNSLPSFGTQVNFSPTQNMTFNWSTFVGTDDPDVGRRMRYFNNFFGEFRLTEKIGLIAGFDIGLQQRTKDSSTYDVWFSPIVIGHFVLDQHWKTGVRAEYYRDETGIIIPTGTRNGFNTTGFSINVDYAPTANILCRLEGRWLKSKDAIFETTTTPTYNNFIIGTSIAIEFSELID